MSYTLKWFGGCHYQINRQKDIWRREVKQRSFSSIKLLSQYMRRNKISHSESIILNGSGVQIFFVGNTEVELPWMIQKVQELQNYSSKFDEDLTHIDGVLSGFKKYQDEFES